MDAAKRKKLIAIISASLAGVNIVNVSTTVGVYDTVFPRYERPDYALYPGQYCIERIPELTRTELWIPSEENRLKAYYYEAKKVKEAKGLVVVAHGMRAGADEYLPIIQYLTEHGYSVLAHNITGTYESEGSSTVGMCQALVDMDRVIAFIQSTDPFRQMPLFTLGHSWGGYAAAAVLALKKGIRACALIAPVCNGAAMIVGKAEEYVGKLADVSKPVIDLYQKLLFGDYVKLDAVDGINAAPIPVLVAQGIDDSVVTYKGLSVTAYKDEIINPNVRYYIGKGLQGDHNNIWHSVRSAAYQLEVESDLKLLELEKGEALTESEKAEYYKTVDHALYSEVNEALMDEIIRMFDSTL